MRFNLLAIAGVATLLSFAAPAAQAQGADRGRGPDRREELRKRVREFIEKQRGQNGPQDRLRRAPQGQRPQMGQGGMMQRRMMMRRMMMRRMMMRQRGGSGQGRQGMMQRGGRGQGQQSMRGANPRRMAMMRRMRSAGRGPTAAGRAMPHRPGMQKHQPKKDQKHDRKPGRKPKHRMV